MELNNKEIVITNNSRIGDIQHEFSASYPFLKIEFHIKGNNAKSGRNTLLNSTTTLNQAGYADARRIDISRGRTVAEVSHDFQDMLGLVVQVSRKSGNIWNTISISDNWTLQSQNIAGEFICSEIALNAIEPPVK